jgi:hypothetical protein
MDGNLHATKILMSLRLLRREENDKKGHIRMDPK